MTKTEQIKLIQKAVGAYADGIMGIKTLKGVCEKLGVSVAGNPTLKEITKLVQKTVGVTADGVIGPKTVEAVYNKLGLQTQAVSTSKWPTQKEVRTGKSIFGKAGDESNLTAITPPYQFYYDGKPIKTIRLHKKIADEVMAVFNEVLEAYGAEKIHELALDVYDGCYNYRSTRSGSNLSMHAWGIAIDFDAAHNTMKMHKPQARYSAAAYDKWWEIWEKHGFLSLGRHSDYDWMHVQAATL